MKYNIQHTKTLKKMKEIEGFIDKSRHIPGFGSFVSEKGMRQHLEELKTILSEELKEAQDIVNSREQKDKEAEENREKMLKDLQDEIESQDITVRAKEYSKDIVQQAQTKASSLINEARSIHDELVISGHQYVDDLLNHLEKELSVHTNRIQDNKEQLRNSLNKKMDEMQKLFSNN